MKRVLFTATLVRGHIAKFHIPYLRWFKEQGWETWVAAANDYPDGTCGIPYCDHYVDVPFSRNPYRFAEHRAALRALAGVLDGRRFDLVHAHTPVAGVLTRLAARRAHREGTVVLYTAHGFHFYRGAPARNWLLWYPVERIASRLTDSIITVNAEDFEFGGRFAHCDVELLPGVGVDVGELQRHCAEPADLAALEVPEGAFAVLGVGDLVPCKNFGLALEALALLGEGFHLVVCGEGDLDGRLWRAAGELGVADRLHLLGFRDDVPAIMAACDAFALTSTREGFSVALLEAAAAGLPIVANRVRGLAVEELRDGENALVLREATPEELASCIRRVADMRGTAELAAMTSAARGLLPGHSLEAVLPQYEAILGKWGLA